MNYEELLNQQNIKLHQKHCLQQMEDVKREQSLSAIIEVVAIALQDFPGAKECGWFNQTCPSVGYRWSVAGKYGSVLIEISATQPMSATAFRSSGGSIGEYPFSFGLLMEGATVNEIAVESFKKYVLALSTLCFKSDIDLVTNGR